MKAAVARGEGLINVVSRSRCGELEELDLAGVSTRNCRRSPLPTPRPLTSVAVTPVRPPSCIPNVHSSHAPRIP